jgi:acyl carrier protein
MLTRDELLEEIRAYLQEERGIDPATVHEDARLREDLGLDSLDLAGIALELQESHDVWFDDDHVIKIRTVRQSIDVVLEQVGERASAPS